MRKVVLQMMTTLNGRLDDPFAWMEPTGSKLNEEIAVQYRTFDSLIVGYTTYKEMLEYWPAAEADPNSEEPKELAHAMNTYKKYVISNTKSDEDLPWSGAELVYIENDAALVAFVSGLKAEEGRDIHLPGGARLAQSFIRLGLVDEFHFYIHPVVSKGMTWVEAADDMQQFELLSTTQYDNGIVGVYYRQLRK